jgi:hypothetical protein
MITFWFKIKEVVVKNDLLLLSFAGQLIIGIIIAIITAWITVRSSLKRFYSEKWWEQKYEAYAAIFEALHHIRNDAAHNLKSLQVAFLKEMEDKLEELKQKMIAGLAELRKHVDIGSFIISNKAEDSLRSFMNELDESIKSNNPNVVEHYELKIKAVDKCLEAIRGIAKDDLRLPKGLVLKA